MTTDDLDRAYQRAMRAGEQLREVWARRTEPMAELRRAFDKNNELQRALDEYSESAADLARAWSARERN